MFIILFFACSCNMFSMDSPTPLGQSPRSAEIFNIDRNGMNSYWVSAGVLPSTMLPRSTEYGYGYSADDYNGILATNFMVNVGMTHRLNKHIDLFSSVGALLNAGQVYVPIQFEGRIYPIRNRVKPYAFLGFGGMAGSDLVLFGSKGFGLNARMNQKITIDIQYRVIKGDVFTFAAYNYPQLQFMQRGVQGSIYMDI